MLLMRLGTLTDSNSPNEYYTKCMETRKENRGVDRADLPGI